jgi:hypothetical protein
MKTDRKFYGSESFLAAMWAGEKKLKLTDSAKCSGLF